MQLSRWVLCFYRPVLCKLAVVCVVILLLCRQGPLMSHLFHVWLSEEGSYEKRAEEPFRRGLPAAYIAAWYCLSYRLVTSSVHNIAPRENIWTANVTFASQLQGPSGQFISVSCFHVLSQFSLFFHPSFLSFNIFLSLHCFFPLCFHKRLFYFLAFFFPSFTSLALLLCQNATCNLLVWYCNFELFLDVCLLSHCVREIGIITAR